MATTKIDFMAGVPVFTKGALAKQCTEQLHTQLLLDAHRTSQAQDARGATLAMLRELKIESWMLSAKEVKARGNKKTDVDRFMWFKAIAFEAMPENRKEICRASIKSLRDADKINRANWQAQPNSRIKDWRNALARDEQIREQQKEKSVLDAKLAKMKPNEVEAFESEQAQIKANNRAEKYTAQLASMVKQLTTNDALPQNCDVEVIGILKTAIAMLNKGKSIEWDEETNNVIIK